MSIYIGILTFIYKQAATQKSGFNAYVKYKVFQHLDIWVAWISAVQADRKGVQEGPYLDCTCVYSDLSLSRFSYLCLLKVHVYNTEFNWLIFADNSCMIWFHVLCWRLYWKYASKLKLFYLDDNACFDRMAETAFLVYS